MVETQAATGRADASEAGEEATHWGLEKSRAAAVKASGESGGGSEKEEDGEEEKRMD